MLAKSGPMAPYYTASGPIKRASQLDVDSNWKRKPSSLMGR